MFKCTECGEQEEKLYSEIPESKIIRIQRCKRCGSDVDKYIQIDTTLLVLDLLLLRKAAFRHLLCNYELGNILWRVAVFTLFCDGYIKWMPANASRFDSTQTETTMDEISENDNNNSVCSNECDNITKMEEDIIFHAAKQFKFYEISASCAIDQLIFILVTVFLCQFCRILCNKLSVICNYNTKINFQIYEITQSLLLANCVKLLSVPVIIWAKEDSPKYLCVLPVFILGSKSCNIPWKYRSSLFGCELKNTTKTPEEFTILNKANRKQFTKPFYSVSVDFEVIENVILKGITVPYNQQKTANKQLKAKLWNLISETLEFDIHLSKDLVEHSATGFDKYAIEQIFLPAGYCGSIAIYSNDPILFGGFLVSDYQNSAFQFSKILRYSDEKTELMPIHVDVLTKDILLPYTFQMELEKTAFYDSYTKDITEQDKNISDLEILIQNEIIEHRDIVLLQNLDGSDLIDVYRSLPMKLKLFHVWISDHVNTEYVMKTDDDSYVDITKILPILKNDNTKTWFGNFRTYWAVDRFGKWKEEDYSSPAYPAFACGSGNVISGDISTWITDNVDLLHEYQGEDVTMGIWMAAINPRLTQDDRWGCTEECDPDNFVIAQQDSHNMKLLWKNKLFCGNPCTC